MRNLPKVLIPTEPGVKPRQSGFEMWVRLPSLSAIASQLTTIRLHYFLIQQIFTKFLLYDRYRYSHYLGWGLQGRKQINKQKPLISGMTTEERFS